MSSPLMGQRRVQHAVWIGVCVVIGVFPVVISSGYDQTILITIGLFAIFGLGLQITLGTGGILNMAHAAFIALGAYASAYVTSRGHSPWLGMLAGMVISCAFAFLVGLPILRLKSLYLAIATLCFSLVINNVLGFWTSVTGGYLGLSGIEPFDFFGYKVITTTSQVYLIWGVLLIAMLLKINLRFSAMGREFEAIKDSELAAATLGVNYGLRKLQIFALGSVLGAVGGSLYAAYLSAITPDLFGFSFLIRIFVLVAIGGMTSLWGAPVGAFCTIMITQYLIPNISAGHTGPIELVLFGSLLVIVMIFAPNGIIDDLTGLLRSLPGRYTRRQSSVPQPVSTKSAV
jgi:branched-chain amino acid transport system permease protein